MGDRLLIFNVLEQGRLISEMQEQLSLQTAQIQNLSATAVTEERTKELIADRELQWYEEQDQDEEMVPEYQGNEPGEVPSEQHNPGPHVPQQAPTACFTGAGIRGGEWAGEGQSHTAGDSSTSSA